MREGWQQSTLGQVATVSAGNAAPQKKELFDGGVHPFIRTSDVGKIRIGSINDSADHLNDEGIKKLKIFPKGTILFPKSGASTFLNHRVMLARDAHVSSHLATIKADGCRALDSYLLHFLTTVRAQDLIQDHKYPSLKRSDIQNIELPLPPLPEQKRIVAIIDEAFEGIGQAAANAEKNLANAGELFESHLNAVFTQKGEGWEEAKIGDVCSLRSGTTVSKSLERDSGDIAYLKVADMSFPGNEISVSSSSRFLSLSAISSRSIFPVGTVIFPKRGGAIATNKKRITAVEIAADLNIMGVIPSERIFSKFLFFYFLQFDLASIGSGSSIPQINNYDIAPLTICFPKALDTQRKITEQLQSIMDETAALETIYQKKLGDLSELKQSILQRAFSGELTAQPDKARRAAMA